MTETEHVSKLGQGGGGRAPSLGGRPTQCTHQSGATDRTAAKAQQSRAVTGKEGGDVTGRNRGPAAHGPRRKLVRPLPILAFASNHLICPLLAHSSRSLIYIYYPHRTLVYPGALISIYPDLAGHSFTSRSLRPQRPWPPHNPRKTSRPLLLQPSVLSVHVLRSSPQVPRLPPTPPSNRPPPLPILSLLLAPSLPVRDCDQLLRRNMTAISQNNALNFSIPPRLPLTLGPSESDLLRHHLRLSVHHLERLLLPLPAALSSALYLPQYRIRTVPKTLC